MMMLTRLFEGPLTKEVNVVLVKLEEIEGLQSWAVNPNRVSLVVKKVLHQ